MTEIELSTDEGVQVVDITDEVADAVSIDDGVCTVSVKHTTAALTINENEERLIGDIDDVLTKLVPKGDGYAHDEIDSNADAHLRSMLLDTSVTVPVEDGELALGTWQSVLLFEGDGPRTRTLVVKSVGD